MIEVDEGLKVQIATLLRHNGFAVRSAAGDTIIVGLDSTSDEDIEKARQFVNTIPEFTNPELFMPYFQRASTIMGDKISAYTSACESILLDACIKQGIEANSSDPVYLNVSTNIAVAATILEDILNGFLTIDHPNLFRHPHGSISTPHGEMNILSVCPASGVGKKMLKTGLQILKEQS